MNPLPAKDKEFITKLKEIIQAQLSDENFGPAELAAEYGISRSGLFRRVKRSKQISVSHFIREVRLEKAKELLQAGGMTVSEVAYAVGFGSPTYFNKCFHDQYGFPPGEVRHQPEPVSETVTVFEGDTREIHRRKSPFNNVTLFAGWMVLLVLLGWTLHTLLTKPSAEKSIAVLPFINDSPVAVDDGFNDQVTEAIRDKLNKIGNLKVTSRTSVERYRNDKNRSTRQIARELGVNYVIEGSGQKIGDEVRITVQLIDGRSDRHLISRQYDRKYEDIFILYTEIALEVVNEIKVVITPEEKDRIKKPPSESQAAMKLIVWGDEMRNRKAANYNQRLEFLSQAETYYKRAIRLDSLYTDAWYGLAESSFARWKTDTALIFVNKALQLDPENEKAYLLKGAIYARWRMPDEMEKYLLLCLSFDPDNLDVNHRLGGLYYAKGEFCRGMGYLFKSLKILGELNPGYSVEQLQYREMAKLHIFRSLFALGFYEEGIRYGPQWLELTNDDQRGYNYNVIWGGIINCRFEETYQLGLQTPENSLCLYYMGMNLIFMRKYDEALYYLVKYKVKHSGQWEADVLDFLIGFAYLKTGKQAEAEKYFTSSSDYLNALLARYPENRKINLHFGTMDGYWEKPDFILTSVYAAKGDKEKALEHLRTLRKRYPASDLQVVTFLKLFPMFDHIRNEPEFLDYLQAAEKHYLSERKKVEKLLNDEGIIL